MAYAKINSVTNDNMAKVSNVAKAALGKIGSIDAPSAAYSNTYSLDFDGSDDHIVGSSITFDSPGTISWWQKTKFTGSEVESAGNFIPFHLSTSFYVYMKWDGSNTVTFVRHSATGNVQGDIDIADEEWHHIVIAWDGGGTGTLNTLSIYVDGVLDIASGRTATYSAPSGTLKFGSWSATYSSYVIDGYLDELGIWSSALTLAEVVQLYNSGEPIDLTEDSGNYASSGDLTGYWRLGDGDTFPTIEDNKGSNDLTMTNMTSGDIVEDVPTA